MSTHAGPAYNYDAGMEFIVGKFISMDSSKRLCIHIVQATDMNMSHIGKAIWQDIREQSLRLAS